MLALQLLDQRLSAWASDGEGFAAVLLQAFGTQASTPAAQALRATLLGEGLGLSLEVQSLPGLIGAYASATVTSPERVLLDSQWLAVASAQELEAVLLEEMGHAIEQRLNGEFDSPGDEGEIFSALLRGLAPSAGSASENDHRWITVGSEIRRVEAAVLPSTVVDLNVSSILNDDGIRNWVDDFISTTVDTSGFVLITQSAADFSGVSTPVGLPDEGFFPANSYHPDIQLPYGNPGNANNVRILFDDSDFFDILELNLKVSELHFAAFSTQGSSQLDVIYTYTDGTSGLGQASVPDWFDEITQESARYYLIDGMDRYNIFWDDYHDADDAAVFGFRLLPDKTKIVQSLRFQKASADALIVFMGATVILGVPTVASAGLTSTSTNGTYGPGSVITIQVPFTETVIVNTTGGIPTLLLETGSTDRTATYSGGSGTNTLRFQYTVRSGDSAADLDAASTTALQLNGGTIRDAAGNNAVLTLPAPGATGSLAANAALVIDGVAPSLNSSTPADGATDVRESANLSLSFSELVQAGTGLIQLFRADGSLIESFNVTTGSGSAGGSAVFSGTTVTLNPFADLASTTAYYLTIAPTAIRDAAGNAYAGISEAATLNFSTGDSVAPTISAITSGNANGTYGPGARITVAVHFSEAVSVTTSSGVPSLMLETGAADRSATYVSGSGSATLCFVYTVQNEDTSADLDLTSTTSLTLNGSRITDVAGNNASLTLPTPGTAGSLGANADLAITGSTPATLTLVNATPVVTEGSRINLSLSSDSLSSGATVYWSASGTGMTAADFTPSGLTGSLTLGQDRRAAFSNTITLDGLVEGDEQLILSFFSDSARTLSLARAQFTLRDLNPTGNPTDERDLLTGTTSEDLISGVPTGSIRNGRGSYDTLTGNGGDDVFVLGTASSVYYDDGKPSSSGSSDLAAITDFNTGDRIQLKGAAADYRLADGVVSGKAGILLYWTKAAGAGTVDEVIGFVQGLSYSELSLTNSSQFLYV